MKAIVLCGGFGTRLGSLTRDMPKPILSVGGRPFLSYLLDRLVHAQVEEIILAVGFQWQKIQALIGDRWGDIRVTYSIEEVPLGTGGAIKHAMMQRNISEALVLNGDTFLKIDTKMLWDFAIKKNADIVMTLKYMDSARRFGKVNIDQTGHVINFEEKGSASEGLINTGFYYVHKSCFAKMEKQAFSFEDEILASNSMDLSIYGIETNAYFLDMGIPDDLSRGHLELPNEI